MHLQWTQLQEKNKGGKEEEEGTPLLDLRHSSPDNSELKEKNKTQEATLETQVDLSGGHEL